jgi:hypothetical protein
VTNGIRLSLAVAALAAGCSLGAASSGRPPERPLESGVRIWAPTIVHWDRPGARHVEFAIENQTDRTLTLAAADPADARVDLFARPDSIRVCGAAPREGPPPREAVALGPGDRLAVRVDLEESCARLPPGDYRYELSYRIPDVGKAGSVKGSLPTSYGEVVIEAPPAGRAGEAVAGPEAPAEERAAEPRAGRRPPSRPRR